MQGPATWVLAQPTSEQEHAVEPVADTAFHQALAAARSADAPDMAILLGERLAWRRGPGGRTVARSWADAGAGVTVIADSDPRHQAATRQLLVDGSWAVEQWVSRVRELGVRGVCWHTVLTASGADARVIADLVRAVAEADLDPMLWLSLPGKAAARGDTWQPAHDRLDQLTVHGADLSRLTVCLPVEPPAGAWGTRLDELVENLRLAIPAQVGQLIVVVPRDRLHLAQSDAYELAGVAARRTTPWPLTHCAGSLALVQAGQWWQVPERADGAGDRFETILGQLQRPTGPVFVRHHESGAILGGAGTSSDTRSRSPFDTSLFRRRSLFGSRTSRQT